MTIINPYRSVQGMLPRKREVAQWPHDKFIDFCNFVNFFTVDQMLKVTAEKRKEIETYFDIPHHPFQEFLYRIDRHLNDPEATSRKFYYRLAALIRTVGGFLKQNPAYVTEDLKQMLLANPRLVWIVPQFKVVETKIGGEVVTQDSLDKTTFQPRSIATAESGLLDVIVKTVNIFDIIAGSIKPHDLKGMPVKDKIASMSKLSFILNLTKNYKPNSNVFKQINIYNAKKEDLEKSILDFAEESNIVDENK